MILNTGNRTDIPAFYSRWFLRRLREGSVLVRNPYDPRQLTRYVLDPNVVDCIVFCTKNPAPLSTSPEARELLSPFRQFWAVTITPYGKDIEPHVPEPEQVMESLMALSEAHGAARVSWRYDPIFLTEKYNMTFHLESFAKMAERLSGYADHCVISFLDLYEKTKRNFPEGKAVKREDRLAIGKAFVDIGRTYGMTIRTCCEGDELAAIGADCGGCFSQPVLERAIGMAIRAPRSAQPREGCACLLGNDIGAYHTCGHSCLYCYANDDRETVVWNMAHHDPDSPLLVGGVEPGDRIHDARQESWLDPQLSFSELFPL